MDRNPYTPPAAAVSDVSIVPEMTRPRQVRLALWLILASFALMGATVAYALVSNLRPGSGLRPTQWALLLVVAALVTSVAMLLAWCLNRGQRWARIVYSASAVLFLISTVKAFPNIYSTAYDGAFLLLALALDLIAVGLMFTPLANAWFRRSRN